MFNPEIIFQRALAGRDEIYEKKRGLTQSERLVLIMVDGVTACGKMQEKLPSLTPERFQRALATLQKKELIIEVFLPVEGQAAEEVEKEVVDRFLRQDPTDPLTIISFDPDDDFGFPQGVPSAPKGARRYSSADKEFVPHLADVITSDSGMSDATSFEPAMDEALIAQADLLAQEVRAARQTATRNAPENEPSATPVVPAPPTEFTPMPTKASMAAPIPKSEQVPELAAVPERMHWGYWLIAIGLAFIGGYLLARLRG